MLYLPVVQAPQVVDDGPHTPLYNHRGRGIDIAPRHIEPCQIVVHPQLERQNLQGGVAPKVEAFHLGEIHPLKAINLFQRVQRYVEVCERGKQTEFLRERFRPEVRALGMWMSPGP